MMNKCHEGAVSSARFLLSGNTLVSAGDDGEVKVWGVEERTDTTATFDSQSTTANNHRLALQRTIHRNKGPVSNLMVMLIDRQVSIACGFSRL